MNRSFDHVVRSPLNHSKSKEAHLFPQAKRFKDPRPSQYLSSYSAAKEIRMTCRKKCLRRQPFIQNLQCSRETKGGKDRGVSRRRRMPTTTDLLPISTGRARGGTLSVWHKSWNMSIKIRSRGRVLISSPTIPRKNWCTPCAAKFQQRMLQL
jgi:hypothetical protein